MTGAARSLMTGRRPSSTPQIQLQRDTEHVTTDGQVSFYRFNSTTTENHAHLTREDSLRAATSRLGSTGKIKVRRTLTAPAARAGHYTVYQFDGTHDKVMVEHIADDQAIVWRYHGWRKATGKGEKDRFDAVPHFHAATIPILAGDNRTAWESSLGTSFPAYTSINGDHHFYYINASAPTQASGLISIPAEEINEE